MEEVDGWPWLPDKCPPDQYFIEYMRQSNMNPVNILHMGTGLHHRVGIECCKMGHRVIGLTVSREEIVSRAFRADSQNYQVFYANLNELDFNLLPELDIVTLFHFGEMASEFGMADEKVLGALISKMYKGGLMVFYNRSAGWGNSQAAIQAAIAKGQITHRETFQELEVYSC